MRFYVVGIGELINVFEKVRDIFMGDFIEVNLIEEFNMDLCGKKLGDGWVRSF